MPDNETVVRIRNRSFPVAVDGLTQLEMVNLAGKVEKKMAELEARTKTADTSKLAILAAFDFAVELYNLRQKSETNREADSKKLEDMVARLENTLEEK